MISIPTTLVTANLIAEANPSADVVHEQGRVSVYLDGLVFVAEIPAPPLTAFMHGYLSRWDDYCLVAVGSAEVTNIQVHAKSDGTATHVVTIKGVRRG